MKLFVKELKIFAILAAAVAVIWLAVSLGNGWRPTLEIDIDTDKISYADCYIGGLPKRLDYADNREVMDTLCSSLSGTYRYVGTWNHRNIDGGVDSFAFYDAERNMVRSITYRQGCVCVPSKMAGRYYLYLPVDRGLSFADLEEAVTLSGYVPRYW